MEITKKKNAFRKLGDPKLRSRTFHRRRNGLFKKAHELSVLCDANLSILIFDDKETCHVYTSQGANADNMMEKYLSKSFRTRDPRRQNDQSEDHGSGSRPTWRTPQDLVACIKNYEVVASPGKESPSQEDDSPDEPENNEHIYIRCSKSFYTFPDQNMNDSENQQKQYRQQQKQQLQHQQLQQQKHQKQQQRLQQQQKQQELRQKMQLEHLEHRSFQCQLLQQQQNQQRIQQYDDRQYSPKQSPQYVQQQQEHSENITVKAAIPQTFMKSQQHPSESAEMQQELSRVSSSTETQEDAMELSSQIADSYYESENATWANFTMKRYDSIDETMFTGREGSNISSDIYRSQSYPNYSQVRGVQAAETSAYPPKITAEQTNFQFAQLPEPDIAVGSHGSYHGNINNRQQVHLQQGLERQEQQQQSPQKIKHEFIRPWKPDYLDKNRSPFFPPQNPVGARCFKFSKLPNEDSHDEKTVLDVNAASNGCADGNHNSIRQTTRTTPDVATATAAAAAAAAAAMPSFDTAVQFKDIAANNYYNVLNLSTELDESAIPENINRPSRFRLWNTRM